MGRIGLSLTVFSSLFRPGMERQNNQREAGEAHRAAKRRGQDPPDQNVQTEQDTRRNTR